MGEEGESIPDVAETVTCQEGETVILFSSHEEIHKIVLAPGDVYQCRNGKFAHDDVIGKPYGSLIPSRKGGSLIAAILPLSPELRTLSLRHQTQIVWAPDLGLIQMLLGCRAGARIVESGTGSGSASTTFARSISPGGKLFTYEFNSARFGQNKEEFDSLGYGDSIECFNRDVYAEGFLAPHKVTPNSIDGVFLDLPKPWLAIQHAHHVLRDHGRLIVFSPCHEQLQESAKVMRQLRYQEMECYEVICKPWGVWTREDVERKRARVEMARQENLKAGRMRVSTEENRQSTRSEMESNPCVFERSPYTLYQIVMKGHTGYVMVGQKPPSDEATLPSSVTQLSARVRPAKDKKQKTQSPE